MLADNKVSQQSPSSQQFALSETLVDLMAGGCGGAVAKMAEYPADSLKSKMQSQQSGKSTFEVARSVLRTEGFVRGFYAGVALPLLGCMAECAVAFSIFCLVQNYAANWMGGAKHRHDYSVVAASAACAGFANGVLLTPVELLKVRIQTNPAAYPTCRAAIKKVIAEEGAAVLGRGFYATCARELIGSMGFFLAIEYSMKKLFSKYIDPSTGDLSISTTPWYVRPVCGGFAGIGLLATPFPIDTVKTLIQSESRFAKMGFARTARWLYRTQGVGGFYSGFGVTIFLRAFPANALVFTVYDLTADAMLAISK